MRGPSAAWTLVIFGLRKTWVIYSGSLRLQDFHLVIRNISMALDFKFFYIEFDV